MSTKTASLASAAVLILGALCCWMAFTNINGLPRNPQEAQRTAQLERELYPIFVFGLVVAAAGVGMLTLWVPGVTLTNAMKGLRPVGMTRDELRDALGEPSDVEHGETDNVRRVTWKGGRVRVTLEMVDGVCTRVLRRSF